LEAVTPPLGTHNARLMPLPNSVICSSRPSSLDSKFSLPQLTNLDLMPLPNL
jgi:hypothetical protein